MAKTQKEIMHALMTALEKGEGGLDDLEQLLARAKEDISAAKAEEKARKAKEEKVRGEKIAEMATRVLNDQATEEDVALVMESYMHQLGLKEVKVDAKDVQEAKKFADKATSTLDMILNSIESLLELDDKPKTAPAKDTSQSADDIINAFLKTLR